MKCKTPKIDILLVSHSNLTPLRVILLEQCCQIAAIAEFGTI